MECNQEKCAFLKQFPKGCPTCSECGAEAHDINEDCTNCWNCLKDVGYIRAGKSIQNKVVVLEQEMGGK